MISTDMCIAIACSVCTHLPQQKAAVVLHIHTALTAPPAAVAVVLPAHAHRSVTTCITSVAEVTLVLFTHHKHYDMSYCELDNM
jgi:hypothetical protein